MDTGVAGHELPTDVDALCTLPGVGDYVAGIEFAKNLLQNTEDLTNEEMQVINQHFWELF